MKRRHFVIVGAVILALDGWSVFTYGFAADAFLHTALALTAVSFGIGGLREEFTVGSTRLRWYHSIGAGIALAGLALGVSSVGDFVRSGATSPSVIGGTLAGLILIRDGIDYLLGGVKRDLSAME